MESGEWEECGSSCWVHTIFNRAERSGGVDAWIGCITDSCSGVIGASTSLEVEGTKVGLDGVRRAASDLRETIDSDVILGIILGTICGGSC